MPTALRALALTLLIAAPAAAQDRGGSGAPPMSATQTPFERFVDRLKLDDRTQLPVVERIFTAAAEQATPLAQQLLVLRQQLVNLELAGKQADIAAVLEAHTGVAATMTGLEAKAFAEVYALLKPNQQSKAPQAFDLMAGLFQPVPSGDRGGRRGGGRGGALFAMAAAPAAPPQRGGRVGGAGGGGGGGYVQSRFEILTETFTLDREQKKTVKTLLDDSYKATAPVRRDLIAARAAIAAAVIAAKPQADVDDAVRAYAVQATAMSAAEMKALAGLLGSLAPPQRSNAAAVQTAFFMMRGMFINAKKWDIIPDQRGY